MQIIITAKIKSNNGKFIHNALYMFLIGQPRPLFVHFRLFQQQFLQKKLCTSAGCELY